MSYFNHAFEKFFLGGTISVQPSAPGTPGGNAGQDYGFVTSPGIQSIALNSIVPAEGYLLGVGTFGFFDPKTNLSVDISGASNCCPLYLAGASVLTNDKIGPFAGGYTETNKSKIINPRFVSKLWRADACTPQNSIVHLGSTPATAAGAALTITTAGLPDGTGYTPDGMYLATTTGGTGTGLTVTITVVLGVVTAAVLVNPGINYTAADLLTIVGGNNDAQITVATVSSAVANCCKEFLCDETYNLRLDVKGSPVLRFLTRDTYYTSGAYTGCCADPTVAPVPVDSTIVFIAWAKDFATSPLINPFIKMIVYDETGVPWFQDAALAVAAGYAATQIWDNYISPGHIVDACAGMVFIGAYVDTRFGDCTFYPTDFYEKEPVRIYPSEVDLNGDPCEFTGLCVLDECPPRQGMGFGESVVRALILSESYRQNFFATNNDLRIREVTQGYDLTNAVNRAGLYTSYFIQHHIPRYNNPSSVFDHDQYVLQISIPVTLANPTGQSPALEAFLAAWLDTCSDCTDLETFSCDICTPVIPYL